MIAGLVLAAGDSRRMGFPKALLVYRGATFLKSVLDASVAAGLDPVMVILGRDAPKILTSVDLHGITILKNGTPETGQIGSIKIGLTEIINHPVEAVVVWPVDQPHVQVATVERVVERFREAGEAISIPTYEGRRGHPVLFARSVFEELLAAPEDEGARSVVRASPERVVEVPVRDPAILEDIDTPEAYEELVRRSGPPVS